MTASENSPDHPPALSRLRVKRRLQLSLIEFSLELLWDRHILGTLWTGLTGTYMIPAGRGEFQLGLYRRYWSNRAVTEPVFINAPLDDQTLVTITAANHTLSVFKGHYKAYREGFYYDVTFGLPEISIEINGDGNILKRRWVPQRRKDEF